MNISINKNLFEKFPGLHLGILVATGIDNSGEDKKILKLLEEIEELIRFEFTPESLTDEKLIPKKLAKDKLISVWKSAYEDLGFEPEHYQTNLEDMMNQIIAGRKLPNANKLADCITYLSLKYLIPIICYDLEIIKGDIVIETLCKERFIGAGITKKTKNAIIFVNGLPPVSKNDVEKRLINLKELVEMFCGGKNKKYLLSVIKNRVEIP